MKKGKVVVNKANVKLGRIACKWAKGGLNVNDADAATAAAIAKRALCNPRALNSIGSELRGVVLTNSAMMRVFRIWV